MPQLAGKGTAGSGQAKNNYANGHDPPRLPAVAKTSGYRRQEPIEEDMQGQHHGGAAALPTKLIQNRGKEDGE